VLRAGPFSPARLAIYNWRRAELTQRTSTYVLCHHFNGLRYGANHLTHMLVRLLLGDADPSTIGWTALHW
jgi:hypothetical protein